MNATFKKVLTLVLVVALTATVAIGGTLAYLTDRDNETNVFTMGKVDIKLNEVFNQGEKLVPNIKVQKEVSITNTGDNDAWVWYTITYPKALDLTPSGKTILWTGFATENHDNAGYEGANDSEAEWLIEYTSAPYLQDVIIDGVEMVQFTVLYQPQLAPGVETPVSLECLYFDKAIDVDADGNLYRVTDGNIEKIDWNIKDNANVYINAYAIQAEDFDNVKEAYAAYAGQWGGMNGEYAPANNVFADVTVLDADDVLKNADGDATVLETGLMIDTTNSKMGLDLGKFPLDVAYQFEPTLSAEEVKSSDYKTWHADFVVSVDKDIPAFGIGLAGYYDAWCSLNQDMWVLLASDQEIKAGEEIRLVKTMSDLMNMGITVSYKDLSDYGNDGIGFLCGAVDLSGKEVLGNIVEQIPAGTTLSVELRLYEATDGTEASETGNYITTGVYEYTFN